MGLGLGDPQALSWLEPPPAPALHAARALLERLEACEKSGTLTPLRQRMAALPLHPRLARLVMEGARTGIPESAALAACLLTLGDLTTHYDLQATSASSHALSSDLWPRMDRYREAESANFQSALLRERGLDPAALQEARQLFRTLCPRRVQEPEDAEARLQQALLRAYPDRVARRSGAKSFVLVGGLGGRLDARSACAREDLVVVLEAEEKVAGTGKELNLQAVSRIEPEWLLEAFPDRIFARDETLFHPASGAVEHHGSLRYEDLLLDLHRQRAPAGDPATGACLAEAALARGLGEVGAPLESLLARLAFLRRTRPDLDLADGSELHRRILKIACLPFHSLKELAQADWTGAVRQAVGDPIWKLLDAWAPAWIQLKGRRAAVHYGEGEPFVSSWLQDFFGMREGPCIAGGAVPLVLHLLAPNRRAVQITTDLAGFWERTYPGLRPALSRRYPKHAWPEKPM